MLAADSGADAVIEAVGKGGAAVIGNIPGTGALATELVRHGVHTMVYNVNSCKPGEWDALERAAARARVRLRCGSHLARFAPVMAGVRAYAEGHVSVVAAASVDLRASAEFRGPRGSDVCALAADVAMAAFGEAPQAVFAIAPEHPHPCGKDEETEPGDHGLEGAPEGYERGVADHTAVTMRFSRGRAALLSIDALLPGGDVVESIPPDAASADVRIYGHGGLLRQAVLGTGSIDAIWAGFGPTSGMRTGDFEERLGVEEAAEHDGLEDPRPPDGTDIVNRGEEAVEHDGLEDGLGSYLPAMIAELETGAFPSWPPPDWLEKGVISEDGTSRTDGEPLDPPWWPARSTWKKGQAPSLPPPSSLAHVMEATLVSINTGAPVYLDQR